MQVPNLYQDAIIHKSFPELCFNQGRVLFIHCFGTGIVGIMCGLGLLFITSNPSRISRAGEYLFYSDIHITGPPRNKY